MLGKGVRNAVENVNEKIKPLLVGIDTVDQYTIDKILIQADGTNNKGNFGANAILGSL